MSTRDSHDFDDFGPGEPGDEERLNAQRAAYEEQLGRVTSAEMALQAAVSLLTVGGRRLGLVPGSEAQRDLEQVRDAIDGVRALLPILERRLPAELAPLRDALSQLQMAYAQAARADAEGAGESLKPAVEGATGSAASPPAKAPAEDAASGGERPVAGEDPPAGPGPAESSGRLWVPGH